LAREVAPHPQRRDALRARASFRNDARWPQPWPRLLLTLSDVDGRAVAARAFTPDQYLGGAPSTPLVAPGQTVEIALEIREPSVETVSYAWDLLEATTATRSHCRVRPRGARLDRPAMAATPCAASPGRTERPIEHRRTDRFRHPQR